MPPTLLSTTHDFLASAKFNHEKSGYDFADYFDRHWANGVVIKTTSLFMLAYEDNTNDAWIIWYCECIEPCSNLDLLKKTIRFMPHYHRQVGWARGLRNKPFKFYSTDRLLRFI